MAPHTKFLTVPTWVNEMLHDLTAMTGVGNFRRRLAPRATIVCSKKLGRPLFRTARRARLTPVSSRRVFAGVLISASPDMLTSTSLHKRREGLRTQIALEKGIRELLTA